MTWIGPIAQTLTFTGPFLQTVLLVRARKLRLWKGYSVFVCYTGLQVVKSVYFFFTRTQPVPYFLGYWIGELIDIPLVVAVLYQLYSHLFSSYEGLRRLQDVVFRWSVAVCLLVATVTAAAVQGADGDRLITALLSLDIAAAVLKVGLIVFLLLISSALSLRWSHYAFGILIGMALYNSIDVATAAVRSQMGLVANIPYGVIKVAAYNCAIVVWLKYFFTKETVTHQLSSLPANDLAAWNQALVEMIKR